MKKLLALALVASLAVALEAMADMRLPEYGQVAGISNQLITAQNDLEALKSLVIGSELASPYLGGIRITYNVGPDAQEPQGEDYFKAIAGAKLTVQMPNEVHVFPVGNIHSGAVQQVFVPCDDFVDVTVSLTLGSVRRIYPSGVQSVHVVQGRLADVVIDTLPPLAPPASSVEELRMCGRAQYYDPENEYGKRGVGDSFPIQRVWSASENAWVTQFGYYTNGVWLTECDVYNEIPQLDSQGGYANGPELSSAEGTYAHAYESRAFPWKDARRVAVRVDPAMLNSNGQATPATNLYFFARVPVYAYKESVETLTITNIAANGTVTASAYPMQIHWVASPAITNYDAAFSIPSWEKVYAREQDAETLEWSTVCLGVKEANYYATYKTAPTSAGNGNWRMNGNNNYTLQSYPWPYRDGSQYGVVGLSRATMNTYAHKLNAYDIDILSVSGTGTGETLATFAAPTGTVMESRRWAGNTWHDYQAFRELAYIQFGANAQSTATEYANGLARVIGIVGNNTTSVLEARQDDLEFYYDANPSLLTFTVAPRGANGYSFSWLGILNFWGSEGDQMADVTVVAESDADGTKSIWYLANLDRARFIPDSSGTATSYANFTDTYGYERLSYYWAYTGLSGTYYRGRDSKADYAAFNLVMTTPTSSLDRFAVNLNSSAYDGVYAPPSYQAVPASGMAYSYWMCSLSYYRSNAIGPWYVYSFFGPSNSGGNYWGARPSLNILATEREAQSGDGQ